MSDCIWKPISEVALAERITNAEAAMPAEDKRFWDLIKVSPTKWQLPPWGDEGGGFWVVALIGQQCVYYNDIEEGFNVSSYNLHGFINEYWCNQDELRTFVRNYREFCEMTLADIPQDAV